MYQKETIREFRRRRAVELIEKGESRDVIARMLGVSTGSLYKWHKIYREGGSLKFAPSGGRPRRLSDDQLEILRGLLAQGATAHGWHNDLWTSKRVAEVIRRHFNIEFYRQHVWVILKQYLGWTVQRPVQQLGERDKAKIERWKAQDLPRILKDADQREAYLIFVDESRFMLTPTIRRTFAPRGQTPVVKITDLHGRISVIGALTISLIRKRPYFLYHLLPDNANFCGISIAQFLDEIRHRVSSPITILWDSIPIHRSKLIKQYYAQHSQLVFERFPSYAPELNPVDKVWLYLKYHRLSNYVPATLGELRIRLINELEILQHRQDVLASCVRKTKLSWVVRG